MTRYKAAAAGIGVLLIFGGCSDDGPKTSSLSKAEFLDQADAVCAEFVADLDERTSSGDDGSDADAADTSVRDELLELTGAYEQVIGDIRAIGFPEEEADELDEVLGDLEDAVDHLAADADGLDPDVGTGALGEAATSVQELTEAVSALRAYGFDECANA